ncbi:MAG TPA: glycosyl transferase family 1, partial [Anaerolineae bacterium]|nr:glycosyl transferase family 1 [Anaerolineae bacterium]
MRLALIGPVYPYRGGIAHYTTRLAQTLRERGHTLLLVSFKRQYPQWLFPGQSDRDPSALAFKARDAHYWLDSLNPLTWPATFCRIRAWRPEALLLQWWTPFWTSAWWTLGVLNRLFLRRPLIFVCHNVLPHEPAPWDPWLAKGVLRWGWGFVTQSQAEKRRLLRLLPGARVEVCPHPVYDMLAEQRLPKTQARERLGLPQDA